MLYLKNTSWWLRSFTGSLFCSGTSFGPEEVILFPEIGREKILFSLTRIIKFVSEYTFQKKKTRRQKAKETKEEKRISAENLTGFDDIMCVCVYVYVYVCVCVCVCISFHRKSFSWLKNNKCNARDRPSILCSGNDSVTSTFVATS